MALFKIGTPSIIALLMNSIINYPAPTNCLSAQYFMQTTTTTNEQYNNLSSPSEILCLPAQYLTRGGKWRWVQFSTTSDGSYCSTQIKASYRLLERLAKSKGHGSATGETMFNLYATESKVKGEEWYLLHSQFLHFD